MTTQNKIEFQFPDGTTELVEISDEQYAFLEQESERLNMTIEETVLKLITDFLEHN